jgi:hypothetical protein
MVRFRGGEKVWPHGDKGYEHDRRWQRGGETKPWNDAKYEGRDHDCGAVNLSLPITVQGNMDQDAVKRLESELVPKLRMMLQQKVGRRG